jgi:PAS domain-containing protein
MTGVVQDISARKSAEDTLRQSEEVLRALANTIPQLAWMAQADGAIVWFNERWFDYTGTTPDQVVGWGWQSTCEPTCCRPCWNAGRPRPQRRSPSRWNTRSAAPTASTAGS